MRRPKVRDERGVAMVLFAVALPLILILTAIAWDAGNWWVHRKHLQTKVDAGALAGGGVWDFPCVETTTSGPTSTQKIVEAARKYVGPHMEADGTPYTATTFNTQVGGTPGDRIHVVLNGSNWWDDDASLNPQDKQSPLNSSICNSFVLDVKATEANNDPLFGWIWHKPDLKRRARLEVHEIKGLGGLLPIAVRVPRPLSAAAVFYNEANRAVLDATYFCNLEPTPFGVTLPAGLAYWTTQSADPKCSYTRYANVNVGERTGVVIATSFRPRCGAPGVTAPCMSDTGFATVDDFCRQGQGTVECFYATGTPQNVVSGLQFIRGYETGSVGTGPPALRSAYLDSPLPAGCGAYFSTTAFACSAILHANLDFGSALDQTLHPGAAADVKYGVFYGTGNNDNACLDGQNRPNCDMSGSTNATATVSFDPRFDSQGDPRATRHSIVLRVRLKDTTIGPPGPGQINCGNNFSATCQWFFTSQPGQTSQANATDPSFAFNHPAQRSFTAGDSLTGPIKWLRLTSGDISGGNCIPTFQDGEAASQTSTVHCFMVEMGLRGAIAVDQDEPAFGFNFKGSQSGGVDCDDSLSNFKSEVIESCNPSPNDEGTYAANDFSRVPPAGPCPWPEGQQVSWTQFLSPPAPYDAEWPAYTCLRTDGPPAPGQVEKGLKGRFFGDENTTSNPSGCPVELPDPNSPGQYLFAPGRNYWDDSNNLSGGRYAFADQGVHVNNLRDDDPRKVNLFMTAYNSFSGSGGAIYAIVGFGTFYITGFGKATGGGGMQIDDPCPGSTLPPDLVVNTGQSGAEFIWGHFINDVVPEANSTPNPEKLCNPGGSFMPCIAALVE